MKKFIFLFIGLTVTVFLALCLLTTRAAADWYVFDGSTNRAVSRAEYQPDERDLASRGEFALFSAKDIPLSRAEFFNNDVRERPLSQAEQNAAQDLSEEGAEMAEIYHIMFEMAYKEAVKRGKKFKKMDRHVDDIQKVKETALEEKKVEEELTGQTVKELKANGKTFKHLKEKPSP